MLSRFLLLLCCFVLGACSTFPPSRSRGVVLYDAKPVKVEEGIASWYSDRRTASGERFNSREMAAAHRKLPFGTKVRVVDLTTKKSVIVRINDRGPYKKGRIIDLTSGAARQLGTYDRGLAKVRVEVLKEIPLIEKPNLHYTALKYTPTKEPPAPAEKTASTSTTTKKRKSLVSN
jgi:rare lipoprotein A